MNKLVDQKIEREGGEVLQVAVDEIFRSSEFDRKDAATIEAEEFLRAKNPTIAESIQGGDIAFARSSSIFKLFVYIFIYFILNMFPRL